MELGFNVAALDWRNMDLVFSTSMFQAEVIT